VQTPLDLPLLALAALLGLVGLIGLARGERILPHLSPWLVSSIALAMLIAGAFLAFTAIVGPPGR
jgi:hypothetical protein